MAWVVVVQLLALIPLVESFPSVVSCGRELQPNAFMMDAPAAVATDGYAEFLRSNGTVMDCGDTYTVGEDLFARINFVSGSWCYIMDLDGATFTTTTCTRNCLNKRCYQASMDPGRAQRIVADDPDKVTVTAGFAQVFGTVQITSCTITAATSSPTTSVPTSVPTPVPSPMPTPVPTVF